MTAMRTIHLAEPHHYTIELHDPDCDCPACVTFRQPAPRALTGRDFALLTIAGVLVGNLIMFAADPIGSAHTLAAALGWPW